MNSLAKLISLGLKYGYFLELSNVLSKISLLQGKYEAGSEILEEIFRLEDPTIGLRYDLTVPFSAKVSAQTPKPYKRMDFGPVFRDGAVTAYRLKEFHQFDYDRTYKEADKKSALAEQMLVLSEVLKICKDSKFIVKVNSQDLVDKVLQTIEKKDQTAYLRALDKLSKVSIKEAVSSTKNVDEVHLVELVTALNKNTSCENFELIEAILGSSQIKVEFSSCLIRGLNFYTGLYFEVYDIKNPNRSLCSGGFYDLSKVTGSSTKLNCIGFSIGYLRYSQITETLSTPQNKITICIDESNLTKEEISWFIKKYNLNEINRIAKIKGAAEYSSIELKLADDKQIRKETTDMMLYTSNLIYNGFNKFIEIESKVYYRLSECCRESIEFG